MHPGLGGDEQLGGAISINGAAGTRVAILLPEPKPTPPFTPPPRIRQARDMLTLLPRKPWIASGRG